MALKTLNPAEMTVEEKLKTLYELQTVLSKIDEIRVIRGELPLEVQDLEDEIEGLQSRIAKYEEEVKYIDGQIGKWKEEKNVSLASIERNEEHLNDVRNSREYDALSKEAAAAGGELVIPGVRAVQAGLWCIKKEWLI